MKKRTILSLICCCLVLGLATGCGKDSENSIKKLNVNFEKYDLPCVSGDVCNEVKGKIVQIDSYEGSINNESYSSIILTSDGNIYLYNALSEKMVKTNGSTKLTHIDGTLDSDANYYNALIYQDDKYYSIEKDGTIKEFNFSFDAETIISNDSDSSWVVDKTGTLQLYVSCSKYKNNIGADKCPTDDTWVKVSPSDNTFLKNFKVKYANDRVLVTEDGKMYPISMLFVNWDYKKLTYEAYMDESSLNDNLIISNPKNTWYWNNDGDSYSGNLIVQTSDGNLHHNWGSFYSDKKFETTITFNEEVKNILYAGGSYYFLIIGKDNVYFASSNFDDNYDLTKLDELKKYKNDIRSFYMRSGIAYVLLSDGNIYKVHED